MNALHTCLLLFMSLWAIVLPAQERFYDFEDTSAVYPYWSGDTMDFEVSDGYLQLRDTSSRVSGISLPAPTAVYADTVIYEFLLEMDTPPASSNQVQVRFLDTLSINSGLAFHIRPWGIIEVYKHDFDVGHLIMSGEEGRLSSDSLRVRVRLERRIRPQNMGEIILYDWFFSADYSGGRDFIPQDTSLTRDLPINRVEISVAHAANMEKRIRLDDILASSRSQVDTVGPQYVSGSFPSPYEVELVFNDTLDQETAEVLSNYEVSSINNELIGVEVGVKKVALRMLHPFIPRENLEVEIFQLIDDNGYATRNLTIPIKFIFFKPSAEGAIVINELMVDPSPPVGLPEYEYIEVYNPTDTSVWAPGAIVSGGFPVMVPGSDTLHGKEYLIFTSPEIADTFRAMRVKVIEVELPALGNGGDGISLSGIDIHYNRRWYNNEDRDNGGYSLEYIGSGDLNSSCQWRASQDPSGGTPGRENSVSGWQDTMPPAIESVSYTAEQIRISFNEAVTFQSLDSNYFEFSPFAPIYDVVFTISNDLIISTQLDTGTIYGLELEPIMYDCAGNYPEKPLSVELLIEGDPTTAITNTNINGFPQLTLVNPLNSADNVDEWQVVYTGSHSSCQLSGQVYDLHGRLVQELPVIDLPQQEGVVEWPGRGALKSGYYTLLLCLVSEQGNTWVLPRKAMIIH